MLEKIGLPAKPSLRGNSWVVDASHCQGCSSQFTFINRKHHCRRCGGIFCGSCTQQRMVLRGQGDSPVRICEPCKRLEEAARFEMRYGHKNRAAKGGSRYGSKKDEDILRDILGNEAKFEKKGESSSSFPNPVEVGDTVRNPSLDLNEMGSIATTPEDLRQQAMAEKNKYKTLKAEGKSEEALLAFKRGKELERQAAALEISLRKNRKKATVNDTQKIKEHSNPSVDNNRLTAKKTGETDDLFTELKDLGWSDQDLRDAEKKPATLSVEGELSSLIREVSQKPINEKVTVSSDKSQVIAHKKRALELKRAGNLAEAKEELKRAKILEKKIEEEELLDGANDSDDELMSLVNNMDGDEHDHDFSAGNKSNLNFNFGHFTGIGDDLAVDGNLDVTDEDMYDPEINSALKSLGWVEDNTADPNNYDQEAFATEIQSLKLEAANQKRAGNSAEALTLLKKAKLLEKEVESSNTRGMEEPLFSNGPIVIDSGLNSIPKSKMAIQKELLAVKRKALTLRREGKLDESAKELEKAKALEDQLEDMNRSPPIIQSSFENRPSYTNQSHSTSLDNNEDEEDVTDQDLHDPAYLSLLKNLGWDDEDNADVPSTASKENNKPSKHTSNSSISQPAVNSEVSGNSRKSKSEIQRELLALKRKALTLRRQGEAEEADQVLKMAKSLEEKLHEFEEPIRRDDNSPEHNTTNAPQNPESSLQVDCLERQARDNDPVVTSPDKPNSSAEKQNSSPTQQEILALKKRAITLKREGKLEEAKEALRKAKLLEKAVNSPADEDLGPVPGPVPVPVAVPVPVPVAVPVPVPVAVPVPNPSPSLSSRERFKLQQESLSHKRNALRLRREGRTAEADSEFEVAKAMEARLQEAEPSNSFSSGDDVAVEDFLDPQLLSMLQSIGLGDGSMAGSPEPSAEDADVEKRQLAERIKAEKVKAVNLKRLGKQAEALDALRRAKLYERKLQFLTS